jgi:hypothetical protein
LRFCNMNRKTEKGEEDNFFIQGKFEENYQTGNATQ